MIQAVIYDMDGVIIDSEPVWRAVEMKVFSQYGLDLTEEMCFQTTGLRVDEVIQYWMKRHPLDSSKAVEIEEKIFDEMVAALSQAKQGLPGVKESLDFFQSKNLRIALASSSPMRLIEAVLGALNIREYFEVLHSAEFEAFGKPHPAVYLATANQLDIPSDSCIAIEDSVNGMISAKAAKMQCIAVPEETKPAFKLADLELQSLNELTEKVWASVSQ